MSLFQGRISALPDRQQLPWHAENMFVSVQSTVESVRRLVWKISEGLEALMKREHSRHHFL